MKLTTFNIPGQEVIALAGLQMAVGHHAAQWDGKNTFIQPLAGENGSESLSLFQ